MNFETQEQEQIIDAASGDTRHPPDVHPNTHIIAVLGTNDQTGAASPGGDGWMVSDFYLWKSVLEGMGKSQQWLTCEPPDRLIEKYGIVNRFQTKTDNGTTTQVQTAWADGYLLGDPFEERRVVLDKSMIPYAHEQLTVTSRGTALRTEFLRRLEVVLEHAVQNNDHVLVLAFCHGEIEDTDPGGLAIGIDLASANIKASDYLSPALFQESMDRFPEARVSLFMTSSFSGHWVVTPSFQLKRPTIMAAARPSEESHAWAQSASQRHAGGVYSSAFLTELLKEAEEEPLSEVLAEAQPQEIRVYEQYRRDVVSEANRLCTPAKFELGMGSLPLFTTEGDGEKAYHRTGFALHNYKANFDRLKRVPPSDAHPYRDFKRDAQPGDQDVLDWENRHPEVTDMTFPERTGWYGSTRRGMASSTIYFAKKYTSSFPGLKEQPSNTTLHSNIMLLFAGGVTDPDHLERIRSQIMYRNWMMDRANKYAKWLNLNKVPRIQNFDMHDRNLDRAILQKAKDNFGAVHRFRLFNRPDIYSRFYGHFFMKPTQYLAHAFAASGYGTDDIERMIPKVIEVTIREVTKRRVISITEDGSQRAKDSVRGMTDVVKSSHKRQRSSLPSGWVTENMGESSTW
ncbi:MAG: hypothetical protein Q9220_004702 [cf. Caloplaca sp. 1 TL-2023]